MPQDVSEAAYLRPRNFRAERFSYRPKFHCRFADPFKAALDGIIDHVVFAAVCFSIRPMFARMSSKRCTGSLEGTQDLSLYAFLHTRLEGSFFDQIDLAAEHF